MTLLAIDDNRHADFLQRFRHLLAIAIIGAAVASSLLGGYGAAYAAAAHAGR